MARNPPWLPTPWQEPGQRVVRRVPRIPALVNPVHHQVAPAELTKFDRLSIIHQASLPSRRMTHGCRLQES
jgi:hypothetical protein